jgi:hypothetical protein
MTRPLAPDPIGHVSASWLVWRGIGPTVRLMGSGSQPTKLLTIAEAVPLLGATARFDPALANLSVRGELLGGSLLHAFMVQGEPTLTIRPDVAVALGGGLTWWFLSSSWARLGLDLDALVGGELRNTRIHTVGGIEVWRRDPFLLTFSLGLTLDITTARPPVENSEPLARGVLDGRVDSVGGEGATGP